MTSHRTEAEPYGICEAR